MTASRPSRALLVAGLLLAACGGPTPAPLSPIVAERPASTLTQATQDVLWDLRLPVLIHAYLTEPTTAALTPHVATIRRIAGAYGAYNPSKITVKVVDPFDAAEIEQYARDRFRVGPVAMTHLPDEAMTVYFSIVIEVGRQVEVLDPDDLVEVGPDGTVTLRDIESLVTERIRSAQDERTTW